MVPALDYVIKLFARGKTRRPQHQPTVPSSETFVSCPRGVRAHRSSSTHTSINRKSIATNRRLCIINLLFRMRLFWRYIKSRLEPASTVKEPTASTQRVPRPVKGIGGVAFHVLENTCCNLSFLACRWSCAVATRTVSRVLRLCYKIACMVN